ncbi:MAG: PLDc N-terminal domain-containing protein [Gammaproteobacteria bacterium]|nr:PLDc N-terminal domain-containing protein [Gammaproteobacteria bacterium]
MLHLFSFILFLISLFIAYRIIKSDTEAKLKVLWIALVLLLPLIGSIVWYLIGPGNKELPFNL